MCPTISQYVSYLLIFTPSRSIINGEQHESISTINPAITKNTECLIVKVCASFTNLKVGVSLDYGVLLCFISLLAVWKCWATFQAQNIVRSTLASSVLTLISHQCHNMRIANRHLHAKGERNGVQGRTKVSFGRTMMGCCSWWKGTSQDEATLNSEEIKAVAIAIIELRLSEGISHSVSHVSRKFC